MSVLPSLSKSKVATPPHIGCGKYFRPAKLLLEVEGIFDRGVTSTKPGRLAYGAGRAGARASSQTAQVPAANGSSARFIRSSPETARLAVPWSASAREPSRGRRRLCAGGGSRRQPGRCAPPRTGEPALQSPPARPAPRRGGPRQG